MKLQCHNNVRLQIGGVSSTDIVISCCRAGHRRPSFGFNLVFHLGIEECCGQIQAADLPT